MKTETKRNAGTSFLQLLPGFPVCYYANPPVTIFEMVKWSEKCLKASLCCVKKTAGLPGPVLERAVKPLDILDERSQHFHLCEDDTAGCF